MKKIKPSEELISIFKKNGFLEITNTIYPDDYKEIQKKGYNPEKHRRILTLNNEKNSIKFDTCEIKLRYNNGTTEFLKKLSIKEIKSIITFYKLPPQTQRSYKITKGKRIHKLFYEEYEYIVANNLQFETPVNSFIISSIESLIIEI